MLERTKAIDRGHDMESWESDVSEAHPQRRHTRQYNRPPAPLITHTDLLVAMVRQNILRCLRYNSGKPVWRKAFAINMVPSDYDVVFHDFDPISKSTARSSLLGFFPSRAYIPLTFPVDPPTSSSLIFDMRHLWLWDSRLWNACALESLWDGGSGASFTGGDTHSALLEIVIIYRYRPNPTLLPLQRCSVRIIITTCVVMHYADDGMVRISDGYHGQLWESEYGSALRQRAHAYLVIKL